MQVWFTLDSQAEHWPGLFPITRSRRRDDIQGFFRDCQLVMHLRQWSSHQREVRPVMRLVERVWKDDSGEFHEVMVALTAGLESQKGQRAMCFFRQLLLSVGAFVNDLLPERGFSRDPGVDLFSPLPGQRRDEDRAEVGLLGVEADSNGVAEDNTLHKGEGCDQRTMATAALKYFLASRQHYHTAKHIRISVDAARIGDLEALCGMIYGGPAGDERSCWMAPQAGGGGERFLGEGGGTL